MVARFTEKLEREDPLRLVPMEMGTYIHNKHLRDPREDALRCREDIYIGVFFDGTNNNKYRDSGHFSHSNVARLYEAFPGMAFHDSYQLPRGMTATPDLAPAWPGDALDYQKAYYRKLYVPGVGTPFVELGDSGEGSDKREGLAFASHGQVRLNWALLQVANHVHAALRGGALAHPLRDDAELARQMQSQRLAVLSNDRHMRESILQQRKALLKKQLEIRLRSKPTICTIRLSVFGFSRGAAMARVFCNWLRQGYGSELAGIKLQVDFLGIFDTVASVGLANSAPVLGADGLMGWASPENLRVEGVRRCVHLVAAHEVRGSFPLYHTAGSDSCKQVVYPGVHSDVGGGYPPNDQGRAVGQGAEGDRLKLSQIPLAQMYREALIGGVPLLAVSDMIDPRKRNFAIAPATIAAFNAYVAATRQGEGQPDGKMWLTETQPQQPLASIMRQHYGSYLRWRRQMLGKVHTLPGLNHSYDPAPKRAQDIADIKLGDDELRRELSDLQTSQGEHVLRDKVHDWRDGLEAAWQAPKDVPPAVATLFATLVHDSRAWFKPLNTAAEDDPDWYRNKHQQALQEQIRKHEARLAALQQSRGDPRVSLSAAIVEREIAKEQVAIAALKSGKVTMVMAEGHEPWWLWGYLRWRVIQ